MEDRYLLAAELGIGPPSFPPGPPPHVDLPEVARRPEHRLPPAWVADLPMERFSGGFEQAEPLIVVGDPGGTPGVTPDSRIDPNLAGSAFAGVVSINVNNQEQGSGLCTGSVITPFHILTAAHCVDVAGGERADGSQTGNGVADYGPDEVNVIFNHDGDFAQIRWGIAAIDVHPDWHGFNNVLAPGGASINDDIAVLTLNQSVPTGVPVYPLHFEAFDSAEQIVLAGYGTTGDGVNGFEPGSSSFTVKRTGQNVTNTYWLDDEGSGTKEVYLFDFDGPTSATDTLNDGLTLGNDIEVTIGPGDSGGPAFLWVDANGNGEIDSGELVQFGVNAFGMGGGSIPASPLFGSQAGGMLVSGYQDFLSPFVAIMEPPSTLVEIDGSGNLLISDTDDDGKDDALLVYRQQGLLVIHDATNRIQAGPGTSQFDDHTVQVDLLAISGAIQVDTAGGDDSLTIDFSGGNPLPTGGLSFAAGDAAQQTNYLRLQGYQLDSPAEVSDLVMTRSGAHAGQIDLASLGTIQYAAVRPISLLGEASDVVIQVPQDAAHPMLNNDGVGIDPTGPTPNTSAVFDVGDGNAGFTEFTNPGASLTLLPAGDHEMLHVVNLLESGFRASLSLGSESDAFGRLAIGNSIHFDEGHSLGVFSDDTVLINDGAELLTSGEGAIRIETSREILIGDGARLEVADGDLALSANRSAEPTAGNFVGVDLIGATLVTAGTGAISVAGRGGDTGNGNIGVRMRNGSTVSSTASGSHAGPITIDGTGGHGGAINHGIVLQGAGVQVTSVDGDILIDGRGNGTTSTNHGLQITAAAVVTSTGQGANAATISILGTGGSGTWGSRGVRIADSGTTVSSFRGDILLAGHGGDGSQGDNFGVEISLSALIDSTGTGADAATITIDGTGGGGTSSLHGVRIADAGTEIHSIDGDILITGQGGDGSGNSNEGVNVTQAAVISSSGTGGSAATITIDGTGGGGASWNRGVRMENAGTQVTSIDGDIRISGQGADSSEAGAVGVRILFGAVVASTGTGPDAATITIDGSGGEGTWGPHGVAITDAGTEVSSIDGDILITGQGGNGTENNIEGVHIAQGAVISSSGTSGSAATITIEGTGGSGTRGHRGVLMMNAGTKVTSVNGDIRITGQGGVGSEHGEIGVIMVTGAAVVSTGIGTDAATITIEGMGGNGTWSNHGVRITDAGTRVTAVDGDIRITGQGGDGSSNDNDGVQVALGAVISSTGTGSSAATITVQGTGGQGAAVNHGVFVHAGARITSVDGDIRVIGQGAGATNNNHGIQVTDAAVISSTGTGADAATITLLGTGGGSTWGSRGVRLANSETQVTSVDGDIEIVGQGGSGSESDHFGVEIATNAVVASTGVGADAAGIRITGFGGGAGPVSDRNHGVLTLESAGRISAVDGDIRVTGIAGTGASSVALRLLNPNAVAVDAGGSANLALVGNSMQITADAAVDAGGNMVTLKPHADAGAIGIDIGGEGGADALGLSDEKLNRIVAGTIRVGDATSGSIDITSPIVLTVPTTLHLVSGGAIEDGETGSISVANLAVEAVGPVILDNGSTVQVLAGRVTGAGNPFVYTNNGALTIGEVGDLVGITTNGGGMTLTANSPLTIDRPVVDIGGGRIRLVASPSPEGGDDLTINAPVRSLAGDGDVELVAGSNLFVAPGTSGEPTVSTSGAGGLSATAGAELFLPDHSISVAGEGSLQVQSPQFDVAFEPDAEFRELALGETRDVVLTFDVGDQTQTLTITVTGTNDPPEAQDATIAVVEDGPPVTTGVLADDIDSDDDPTSLWYTILSDIPEGDMLVNGDGTFTFDPGSGFQDLGLGETRQFEVAFVATDRHGASSNVATITVTVAGVNDPPQILLQPGDSANATFEQTNAGRVADGRVTVRDVDVSDEVVASVGGVTTAGPRGDLSDDDLLAMMTVNPLPVIGVGETSGGAEWRFDSGAVDFHHLTLGESLIIRYTLIATDTHGESAEQTITIEVRQSNHPPAITAISTDATAHSPAQEGTLVTVVGSFFDADVDDTHTVTIDWGDGSPIMILDSSQVVDRNFTASHSYTTAGMFDVVANVSDAFGGSATANTTAVVSGAAIHQGVLWVIGTEGDDRVHLNAQGNGHLRVHADHFLGGNHRTFALADFDRIIVDLLGGDDHFTTAGNVNTPLLVRSASGDNRFHLAGGPAVVVGGVGNDDIRGGAGRNVLIGGGGSNTIRAGRGGDLLVGGATDRDDDNDGLFDLLAAWNGNASFGDRVDQVLELLSVATDEEATNSLHSGAGHDLVFADIDDLLKGNRRSLRVEVV